VVRSRRVRGALLRFARNRPAAIAVGLLLVIPSAWIELSGRASSWWMDGVALVAGATGLALVWTALTGTRPDWLE
jgi:hypothetical protein